MTEGKYVNLEEIRALKAEQDEALATYIEAVAKVVKVLEETPFCDRCGRVDPPGGFYPLYAHGPNSISGLHCNKCDEEMRKAADGHGEKADSACGSR